MWLRSVESYVSKDETGAGAGGLRRLADRDFYPHRVSPYVCPFLLAIKRTRRHDEEIITNASKQNGHHVHYNP
jgi:hypothetical protein